jgi:hypothetical protein
MAMDRQSFRFFSALNGPHRRAQVRGNLFPGIETDVVGRTAIALLFRHHPAPRPANHITEGVAVQDALTFSGATKRDNARQSLTVA